VLVLVALSTASIANATDVAGGWHLAADSPRPEIEHSEEAENSAVQAQANLTVLAFAKSKPPEVFERVRSTMADALETRAARSLEEAYVVAVYLHFNVSPENYRQLGLSDAEYRWLLSSKDGLPDSHKSSSSERI